MSNAELPDGRLERTVRTKKRLIEAYIGVASLLLFTYIGLLVLHHKRALEHAAKVRYLSPAREPRPAVVVLRSDAAR